MTQGPPGEEHVGGSRGHAFAADAWQQWPCSGLQGKLYSRVAQSQQLQGTQGQRRPWVLRCARAGTLPGPCWRKVGVP